MKAFASMFVAQCSSNYRSTRQVDNFWLPLKGNESFYWDFNKLVKGDKS